MRAIQNGVHVCVGLVQSRARPIEATNVGYIGTQNLRDPVGILGFTSLLKRTGRKT